GGTRGIDITSTTVLVRPRSAQLAVGRDLIGRVLDAIEDPADEVASDGQLSGSGPDEHGCRGDVDPAGTAENLDDHPVSLDLEDLAPSQLAGGGHDVDEFVVSDVLGAFGHQQRAGDVGHGAVFGGVQLPRHPRFSSSVLMSSTRVLARCSASSAGHSRIWASPVNDGAAATVSAGTPRSTAVRIAVSAARIDLSIAICLAGAQ